jgi:hypothetical protein
VVGKEWGRYLRFKAEEEAWGVCDVRIEFCEGTD